MVIFCEKLQGNMWIFGDFQRKKV